MSKPTKFYSSIQEHSVSDYLGWKVVSGSGARDLCPGDVSGGSYLGECKTHTSKIDHIEFRNDFWVKIKEEAYSRYKYPILICDDGTQDLSHTWIATEVQAINLDDCILFSLPNSGSVNIIISDPETIISFFIGEETCGKVCCGVSKLGDSEVIVTTIDRFKKVMN